MVDWEKKVSKIILKMKRFYIEEAGGEPVDWSIQEFIDCAKNKGHAVTFNSAENESCLQFFYESKNYKLRIEY